MPPPVGQRPFGESTEVTDLTPRYVGILVNASMYRGIPVRRTGHESLANYERAAERHGLVPCFFRLCDIRPGRRDALAYVRSGNRYVRRTVPLPQVIHNRGLWPSPAAKRRLEGLARRGTVIFNQWNRHPKLRIHELLMLAPPLRPHLPQTEAATAERLREMMELHESLIVKPNSGSVGRGVMKLDRTDGGWVLDRPATRKGRGRIKVRFAASEPFPPYLARTLAARTHIIQQRLPLAEWNGRPFDLRVSVQKDGSGDWQITGINVKVARKEAFLTNVAQGATVYDLPAILNAFPHLQPEAVRADVEAYCLGVANHLERHLPHLADLGLDIGLTEFGFPMFIECNGRDQRYSFREAGMMSEWRATYTNPLGYARYLLDRIDP